MTTKDLVFIVSAGRTGTRFLGERLSTIIPDAFSTHEPDLAAGLSWRTWEGIKEFGVWHMVLGRVLGLTGARCLAKSHLTDRLSHENVVKAIRTSRERYFQRRAEPLLIEANFQWSLLLPQLRQAFPLAKMVLIVRNERSWVNSWLKLGRYTDRDLIANSRLSAVDVKESGIDRKQWSLMTPEEKLRWEWELVNSRLTRFAAVDPLTRLFKFEDLFEAEARTATFRELLDFVTKHDGREYVYELDESQLSEKINAG